MIVINPHPDRPQVSCGLFFVAKPIIPVKVASGRLQLASFGALCADCINLLWGAKLSSLFGFAE